MANQADFDAWKAKNVAHMNALIESGTDEIDEGWPDPSTWNAVPQEAEDIEPESYDEPPVDIVDLVDPSLTPRQNLDVLTSKFAAAKNAEEYARSNGDMKAAMEHLKDAERFESGIKWNRAVLVEVV